MLIFLKASRYYKVKLQSVGFFSSPTYLPSLFLVILKWGSYRQLTGDKNRKDIKVFLRVSLITSYVLFHKVK